MKKVNFKIVIISIIASVLLSSCNIYKSIDIGGVDNVDFKGMADNKVSLQLKVPVENPNGYKLKITKMDLDVTINGKYLGKMTNSEDIIIPKNQMMCRFFRLMFMLRI